MKSLKSHDPGVRFSGVKVTPDEIDRYERYLILGPMIGTFTGASGFGSVAGTASTVNAIVWNQVRPDYPRNVEMKITVASGSAAGGTVVVTGKNQFGSVISETIAIANATNGGTTAGTKVFGYFTAATVTMGTNEANATASIDPHATGTTALFGLPFKLGAAGDVKLFNFGSTGVAKQVNGGTYASFVDATIHAIKAPNTLTTPAANATWLHVWAKPTYNAENDLNPMANL